MKISSLDIWAVLCLVALSFFGALNLFGIRPDLFWSHIGFLVVGFAGFVTVAGLKEQIIRVNMHVWFGLFVTLLLITVLFGVEVRGARRWIEVISLRAQVSELFKPFFLLITASLLTRVRYLNFREVVRSAVYVIVPLFLIFRQPDLGNTILYVFVFISLLYAAGSSTRIFVYLFGFVLLASPFIWGVLKEYQRQRIIGFLNPTADPLGVTYNLHQSIIAAGSGGFFGKGLGLGTQSRFQFLPEFHTDFAYASLVEQFGFAGGVVVLILFAVLIYRLLRRLQSRRDDMFVTLYITGTVLFITYSLFINIGMNLGILPITGISLPLISYGGSSLVATIIMLGLALSL